MKLQNVLVGILILVILLMIFRRTSSYANPACSDPKQTFDNKYRCYSSDKESFNPHVKTCGDCSLPKVWDTE